MPIRKVLHAADIHLDSPLLRLESYPNAPIDTIRSATRKALTNLTNLAIDQQVDLVVIAGDLYDGNWNDISTGLHFVSEAAKLIQHGIPLVIIRGNHDAKNVMTHSLPLPKNPDGSGILLDHEKAEQRVFEKLGMVVQGRSFPNKAVPDDFAVGYPPPLQGMFNIGLLHTSLTGAEGHDNYAPCQPQQLQDKGYDYWALGHIHDRRECHETGATPIVFSGNIQGRNIREVGAKGCVILSVSEDKSIVSEFHPLDVMRWQVYERDVTEDTRREDIYDAFTDWLGDQLEDAGQRPLAVRVVLKGTSKLSDDLQRRADSMASEFQAIAINRGGGQVWFENLKVRTTAPRRVRSLTTEGSHDDPLESIHHVFESIRTSEEARDELLGPLKPLWRRLPPELVASPTDPFQLDSPELLSSWLDAAEPMLIEQLHATEADE
jgi:DNA repair exonuclease SbcCD nuclease subunit